MKGIVSVNIDLLSFDTIDWVKKKVENRYMSCPCAVVQRCVLLIVLYINFKKITM